MSLKDKIQRVRIPHDRCGELTDRTVFIGRSAKVVKGGRRFGFRAIVLTGDNKGHIGFGIGKASEVPDAIKKASEAAKKAIIKVPLKGATIPHDYVANYGPTTVVMKPAKPGTGVIAGATIRTIAELAGLQDFSTKCIGSSNHLNVIRAVFTGFLSLKDPDEIGRVRGINLQELGYSPY